MDEAVELVTIEERNEILRHAADQMNEAVEIITSGRNVDASDAVEWGVSITGLFVGAAVPAVAKPVVGLLWPMVSDMVTNAVEAAEARARTPERIAARIEEMSEDIIAHENAIAELEATPKRELFERVRIALRRARINAIERKQARLESYLDAIGA